MKDESHLQATQEKYLKESSMKEWKRSPANRCPSRRPIPGSATCDHLIILDQTIEEIRNDKKTTYIIFLDVQEAYDKAWLDGILHALHRNGVEGKHPTLIKKLKSNLRARIHTRHGLTREIKIKDSIRLGQLHLEPTRPNGLVGCKVPTDLVKISVKEATHMAFVIYIHYKAWDKITYPFLNFNGASVEV